MTAKLTRLAMLIALAVLWAFPAESRAGQPSSADMQRAGELYNEGMRLFDDGLYAAALDKFKAANAVIEHEVNYYNIARAYEQLGAARECIEGYEKYLTFYKDKHGNDPTDVVNVRASIQKCRLLMRPDVTIGSNPEGAKVYIDDRTKLLGQTPYATTLDPGTYTIYLDLDGHIPFEEQVEVRAGEPVRLFFRLEKFTRVGTVVVKTNIRGASVFVDGRNIGLTPYREPITLDEGQHQITIQKQDYTTFNEEIVVEVNQEQVVRSELYLRDPPMTWKGYLGYTALGLGVGGVAFGVVSSTQANKYFAGTDDFDRWEGFQNIGYGVGGGLMGVGVLLLILDALDTDIVRSEDAFEEASTAPRVMPVFGMGASGGGVVGADVRF